MECIFDAERISDRVQRLGFSMIPGVLGPEETADLTKAISRLSHSESSLQRRGGMFAIRNLLDALPEIAEFANGQKIRSVVEPVLGKHFIPIRGILFDKIPEANWKVPWHQDVTIAVQERFEVDGFGPWTTKAGVLHVQPPAYVLENMLSVRIHLDACDEENGALRVVPGSHRRGRVPENAIPDIRAEFGEYVCAVPSGGALLMRPLLLHASSPSRSPAHRRVIHLDFSSRQLPGGLAWFSEKKSVQ